MHSEVLSVIAMPVARQPIRRKKKEEEILDSSSDSKNETDEESKTNLSKPKKKENAKNEPSCQLKHSKEKSAWFKNCHFFNCRKLWVVVVVFLVAAVFDFTQNRVIVGTLPKYFIKDQIQEMHNMLRSEKNHFQNQSNFTWKVFNKTMECFMKMTTERKPVTLLILGTENNRELANCLSERIQNIVTSVIDGRNCTIIQTKQLPEDENKLKLKLEIDIKAVFDKPCHAAVVQDIDLLHHSGLTILQPYSDDTTAYKDVIIILTATTKSHFPDNETLSEFSQIARMHLEKAWDHNRDYQDAWLSRFLQNVAVTKSSDLPEYCVSV